MTAVKLYLRLRKCPTRLFAALCAGDSGQYRKIARALREIAEGLEAVGK